MKQLCMLLAAALVAATPTPAFAHHQSMVTTGAAQRPAGALEQNKALARAFVEEVFNRHSTAAADKYLAKNFVDHAPWPGQKGDLAGFKAGFADLIRAMPDTKATVKHMVAEGDKVFVLMTVTGTDTGGMMGQKPTQQKMTMDAYDLLRFQNGKVVEHWGTVDMSEMMKEHDHGHDHDHGGHQH